MDTHVNLSKWNPFKFLRKSADGKRSEPGRPNSGDAPTLPASSFLPSALLLDPFRMLQTILVDPLGGNRRLDAWFGDYSPSVFQPRIDVVDDADALRITAELPGMDRENLHIAIEDGALVLRGEKTLESEHQEQGCYRTERAFGRFERVIPLPDGLDLDRAEASFDKGVLTIRIPKSTAASDTASREITIQ